jgi:hypothetical protein
VKGYVSGLRDAVAESGRARDDVLIYGQALIITAPTSAQAHAKQEDLKAHVDIEAALALLSGWTGVDFSRYPLDATIDYLDTQAGRTALASFSSADPTRRWTVGEAAAFIGLGGRGPVFVGDPSEIADQLIAWQDATGLDGFNLAFALAHETFRDVVDLVVPELRRRGRYRPEAGDGADLDTAPKTLRARLFGAGDRLKPTHAGRRVRLGEPSAAAEAAAEGTDATSAAATADGRVPPLTSLDLPLTEPVA